MSDSYVGHNTPASYTTSSHEAKNSFQVYKGPVVKKDATSTAPTLLLQIPKSKGEDEADTLETGLGSKGSKTISLFSKEETKTIAKETKEQKICKDIVLSSSDKFIQQLKAMKFPSLHAVFSRHETISQYQKASVSANSYKKTSVYYKFQKTLDESRKKFAKESTKLQTVIIGLEDLLIHFTREREDPSQIELQIGEAPEDLGSVFFFVRPFMHEFLAYISSKYEVIVFCSGSSLYCDIVLDYIESSSKYFAHRVYNTYVMFEHDNHSVKYYKFLLSPERTPANTLIADISAEVFALELNSGITTSPYREMNLADRELLVLANTIDKTIETGNVSLTIEELLNIELSP